MKRSMFALVLNLLVFSVLLAQSETPTPTPEITSIFDYDICAPPCWMGITPGESTSKDVEKMFDGNRSLINPDSIFGGATRLDSGEYAIDPETGNIITGIYSFNIGNVIQPSMTGLVRKSRIEIDDGEVSFMLILPDETISLKDVLEQLGKPDIVRLQVKSTSRVWLFLIYLDTQTRVNLTQSIETCNLFSLESMQVDGMLYFSKEAAKRLRSYDFGTMQPDLTGYRLPYERDVPIETWEQWLSGEVDMSCEEAWAALPTPEITPVVDLTPTATPAR